MNCCRQKILFLIFGICASFVLQSCQTKPILKNTERMPVEVTIDIPDSIGNINSSRPIKYGLIQNQPYRLIIYAEKFTYKVDGELQIDFESPDSIIIEGEPNWRGKEKSKEIEIEIIPTKTGDFETIIKAHNIDSGFSTTTFAILHVEATSEEVMQWLAQNK